MPIKLSIVGKKFRPQPRRVPSSISRNAITQNSGAITRSMFFPTSVTSLTELKSDTHCSVKAKMTVLNPIVIPSAMAVQLFVPWRIR